ncbi:MAG: quinone oxidoreductase family protein [Brevundimonas sp.]
MKAIQMTATGGPEVLTLADVATRAPGPGEIRIRHDAIGVNFIDTYHRSGLYPVPLPSGLGLEGAGIIDAVGDGVSRFSVGDRAGYCTGPIGAYSESHVVPADRAVRLPDAVSSDAAASSLLKGMTARYLLRATFRLGPDHVAVIHAAAGGVGQIAVQWAKHLGATVIAVVGSDAKAQIARDLGADHVVLSSEPLAERVKAITDGRGADVVYDSVGKDTFFASLDCLAPLGMIVSYGNASGPPPAVEVGVLSQKGSLFLTRPTLFHYTRTPELLQETADDLFAVLHSGAVTLAPPTVFRLPGAAQAHRALEARATTGSLILRP